MADTVEVLRDMIVEEFKIDREQIQADTDLESLGIDSLSIIEFVFKVEDRFNVILPDRRAEPAPAQATAQEAAPAPGQAAAQAPGPAPGQATATKPAKRVWTLRDIAAELDALIAAGKTVPPAPGRTP